MNEEAVMTSRNLNEAELAKALQAHFRRFVASARLTQDQRTGEPVVTVVFADRQPGARP